MPNVQEDNKLYRRAEGGSNKTLLPVGACFLCGSRISLASTGVLGAIICEWTVVYSEGEWRQNECKGDDECTYGSRVSLSSRRPLRGRVPLDGKD